MTDNAPATPTTPKNEKAPAGPNPGNAGESTLLGGGYNPSDRHSLTLGPDGPLLLHDHHLVNTLAHFNRENIPDRKPHAKGSGAFGELEITGDITAYTRAAVFQPGTKPGCWPASRRWPGRPARPTPGATCAGSR